MSQYKSIRSARSDTTEMDADGAESEKARLQRQLRIMEGERQAYSVQAREQIRKQQQEIEMLQREEEELRCRLGVSKNAWRLQRDGEDAQRLQALLEQRDALEEELRREQQSHKELQQQISSVESKVSGLRKEDPSSGDAQTSAERRRQKSIRTLEYKLDRALTQFSKQLSRNNQLREELQTLHIERVRFQKLFSRREKELHELRKKIGETITQSTATHDARTKAETKAAMMREKAVKDLLQYNAEMKELERFIAHESSVQEFVSNKCSERAGPEEGQEAGQRRVTEQREPKVEDLREESLEALQEAFEKIQLLSGEDDLDVLVTKFIQVEDQNFGLFSYVNEQNNKAEALRDQIKQIRSEMERFGVEGLQQERDHQASLQDMEEQLQETNARTQDHEEQDGAISRSLDRIKAGVSSIFSRAECDSTEVDDLLRSSAAISDNNVMSYLGLVEQKTNELLTALAFLDYKDLEKEYNPGDLTRFLFGQKPETPLEGGDAQAAANSIEYHTHNVPAVVEEERPLTQAELRRHVWKKVLQEESSKAPKISPRVSAAARPAGGSR